MRSLGARQQAAREFLSLCKVPASRRRLRSAHKPALASGSCQRKTAHASVWRSPAGGAWVFRTCRLTFSPRAAQGVLGQPGAITCCLNTRKSRGRVPTVFVTPLQDSSGSTAWFVHGRSLLWPEGDFFGLTCKATRVRTQQLCCGARLTPGASSGLCTLCCTRPAACLRTRPPSSLSIVRARPSSPPHQPPGTHGSVHRTWALGGDRMVSLLRAPDTRVLTRVQNLFLFLSLFRTFGDLWASPLGSPAGHGRPACKGAG